MSFNGSGTFLINTAGQPVVSGTVISSTAFNALTADLATGLSTAITKDGQTTVAANIPMAGYKFTGLGTGSAATDSANLSQVQSTAVKLLASVSGADTITAVGSPTVAAYAAGQMFYFVAAGDNTGAVTLNIDSLGAKAVTRDGSTALAAGDIKSGEVCVVVYDGTRFQMINAANSFGDVTINGTLSVTGQTVLATSTGNVGIGTSSPGYKLDVRGVTASGNGTITTGFSYDTGGLVGTFSNHALGILTNGTVVAKFDTYGNLGLGVTPSAWGVGKAFQVNNASVMGYLNRLYANANTYFDGTGTAKYIASDYATSYQQLNGQHQWFTAPSGTAGNAITFTQAMTLDASGNLGVGTTSPSAKLEVNGSIRGTVGTSTLEVVGAGDLTINASNAAGQIAFRTAGSERARITADGVLCLNTTVANGQFSMYHNGATIAGFTLRNTDTGSASQNAVVFERNTTGVGSITTTNTATAYVTSSDRRLKENVSPAEDAGSVVDSITVVQHDWKVGGHVRYGVIAQDLYEVAPEAVAAGDDGDEIEKTWGVDYSKLVPMLVKEIQSLRARVAALEAV